jgi:hypothetical protein
MKFQLTSKMLAMSALAALLSACGGGGGSDAVTSPVTASVTSAPDSVALGKTFTLSGLVSSTPTLMKSQAWSYVKLTAGAPDIAMANASCDVAVRANKTVNSTSQSDWSCDTVVIAPSTLTADSTYRFVISGSDASGNSASAYKEVTISSGSVGPLPTAPVATTQSAITVTSGDDVGLNCLASGGTVAATSAYRFQWVVKSNPSGLSLSTTSVQPSDLTFKAPGVSAATTVTFQCRVTDDNLATGTADSVVTINPAPTTATIANAGGSQTVTQGTVVTLNGAGSTSTAPLYYTWTQVDGPAVTLAGANTVTPTFLAPTVSTATRLTFRLVAQTVPGNTANAVASEIDTAVVYVNPQVPLQLVMPISSVVKAGSPVSLTVSVSPAGQTLYYEWTKVSGPAVTLGGSNTANVSFIAPTVASSTEMLFTVKVSRTPIASAQPSEIYTSDVVISVSP